MKSERTITPPNIPLRFLRWFCKPDLIEDVEGDLNELFYQRFETQPKRARLLFIKEVLLLFRPGIIKNLTIYQNSNNNAMIKNYVKTALRHFLSHKGYAVINILGLTIGITCSLLILSWIESETGKDRFHANTKNIYQIMRNMHLSDGEILTTEGIPQPLENNLENKEIESKYLKF